MMQVEEQALVQEQVLQEQLQLQQEAVMSPEVFAAIHPKAFHLKFLEQGVRPDARALLDFRAIELRAGDVTTADSSAVAQIGNTSVLSAVKLEVCMPTSRKPDDGVFHLDIHLWPHAYPPAASASASSATASATAFSTSSSLAPSMMFGFGRATETCALLSASISSMLLDAGIIDLSQLSIESGKSAWVVHVDVMCLSFDGNLRDAVVLSVVHALQLLRLPATSIDESGEVFITEEPSKPFILHSLPITTSFARIDSYLLADASAAEEELMSDAFSITFNDRAELVDVYKPGHKPIDTGTLERCMQMAKQRVRDLLPLLLRKGDEQKSKTTKAK